MMKNRLLATSIVAFGMFCNVEGMNNGLPKLNLTPMNTNSVNQFAAVPQFTSNSNTVNLQEQGTRDDCNVCKESINLSEALKIRKENSEKQIESKNVTFDEAGFITLLTTKGSELVAKGIITLLERETAYEKKNIKSIDLEKFEEVYGIKITKLGDECFKDCTSLKTIIIPESVAEIGKYCFWLCESLEEINLPIGLKKLVGCCFYFCTSLKKIIIPQGVTKLGDSCFNGCKSLTKIELHEDLEELGKRCFLLCESLQAITIPKGVTKLEDECFRYCKSLTKIELHDDLKELGSWCFWGCTSLTTLYVDMLNGQTKEVEIIPSKDPTYQIIEKMRKLIHSKK